MSFVLADEKGLCWRPYDSTPYQRYAKQLVINGLVKLTLEDHYYISFWDLSKDNKSISIDEAAQLLKCTVKNVIQGEFKSYGFKYETPRKIEFEKSGYLLTIGYQCECWFGGEPRSLSWSAVELRPKKPSNGNPNANLPQIKEIKQLPTDLVIVSKVES